MEIKDVTPSNVKNFASGHIYYRLHLLGLCPSHIEEQAALRSSLCPECVKAKKCVGGCGCTTPQLFYAPHKEDSKGRWGPMEMNPDK